MASAREDIVDHRLHDLVVGLVLDHGPQRCDWLVRRARRELRDARVDLEAVGEVLQVSTMLVHRPDGLVDHVLSLLEGNVLTHRVRAPLQGRADLWLGCGVQPLLNVAAFRPLVLADGAGEVRRAPSGADVLVGPPGWLPDVGRYELVGLRIQEQRLVVEIVDESTLPPPEQQLRLRRMLSSLYAQEHYFGGEELSARPAALAQSIALGLLEDPELFATPQPPLDELLHNPLQRHVDLDHWRSVAVSTQIETVGFWVDGIPAALHSELVRRARRYGMTDEQFIVALLGTLAWRTPFAEDMEPWPEWEPPEGDGQGSFVRTPVLLPVPDPTDA